MTTDELIPVIPGAFGGVTDGDIVVSEELVLLSELQYGFFCDYGVGVHGVALDETDPPCTHPIDNIHLTAPATITYDSAPAGMDPLPMMARLSAATAVNCYFEWSERTFPVLSDHYGSLYFYLNSAPAGNIRIANWSSSTGGRSSCLDIDHSTLKIRIQNSVSTTQATSSTVFSVQTLYRLEWHILHSASGTFTLRIYAGHSETPLETLSANFDVRPAADNFSWGNVASAAGIDVSVGGIAENCIDWVGPYTEPRGVHVSDSSIPFEYWSEGVIVLRADQSMVMDLGQHPLIQRGDIVATIGSNGITVGPNRKLGNPLGITNQSYMDVFFPATTGRGSLDSLTLSQLSDPSDCTFIRYEHTSQLTDTDATIVDGDPEVAFANYTFGLIDRGRTVHIDGDVYNILEITSPTTCTVTPTPSATGTGLSRTVYPYPYPLGLLGVTEGVAVGQVRWTPATYPVVRFTSRGGQSTGTAGTVSTTAASAVVTGTEFTQADVGRAILINDDPTLAALAPQMDCFMIVSVVDGVSATVDTVVPSTLANVPYAISCSDDDINNAPETYQASNPGFNSATLTGKTAGASRNWGNNSSRTNVWTSPMNASWQLADNDLYSGNGPTTDTSLNMYYNGDVLAGRGLIGYDPATGAGGSVTQSTNKSTAIPAASAIDGKACGQITMNGAALASGTSVGFTVNNSLVSGADVIIVNMASVASLNSYLLCVDAVAAGSFHVTVRNNSGGSLSEAVKINFAVLKGDS